MSIQTRVIGILSKPADEWRAIAAESTDPAGLMREYAAPLAAIPAVCQFLGLTIVGVSLPLLGTYRTGMARGLSGAIVSWIFALAGAWLAAMVVDKLAPTFQSHGGMTHALKLVVYAMTPVWVAGVLNLIPALSVLAVIAALYAIYLFYLGLPVLMSTPADKIVPYMVVSALVIIVLSVILGACAAALTGIGGYGM
jgi:amino acid transporter